MKKIEVTYKEPGGLIWKLIPDEAGKYLVIESRETARRRTILSVLNLTEAKILYSTEELPKPWWIALTGIEGNKIVFEGYKESNSPELKGFYLFDLLSGKLLQSEEEGIYNLPSTISTNKVSDFPLFYNEGNIHYPTIAEFIKTNYGYDCFGPMEYLEYNNFILISFYFQVHKKLTNILLVINEEGNEVLKEVLMEGADGVAVGSFFLCKGKLVYIKNKTSIALADLL